MKRQVVEALIAQGTEKLCFIVDGACKKHGLGGSSLFALGLEDGHAPSFWLLRSLRFVEINVRSMMPSEAFGAFRKIADCLKDRHPWHRKVATA